MLSPLPWTSHLRRRRKHTTLVLSPLPWTSHLRRMLLITTKWLGGFCRNPEQEPVLKRNWSIKECWFEAFLSELNTLFLGVKQDLTELLAGVNDFFHFHSQLCDISIKITSLTCFRGDFQLKIKLHESQFYVFVVIIKEKRSLPSHRSVQAQWDY